MAAAPDDAADEQTAPVRPKKSMGKGDAEENLISRLTLIHGYDNGSVSNTEPIGCNELARQAGVVQSSASEFFKKHFGNHAAYKQCCGDKGKLIVALQLLNGEVTPRVLSGAQPVE